MTVQSLLGYFGTLECPVGKGLLTGQIWLFNGQMTTPAVPDGDDARDRAARALDEALGKAVRALRRAPLLEWTQDDLAEHAGLSKRTIVRIEAGKSMTLPQMYRIATALKVSMSELLAEAEKYRQSV